MNGFAGYGGLWHLGSPSRASTVAYARIIPGLEGLPEQVGIARVDDAQ